MRVLRKNEVLYEGELLSLKHLKVRSLLNNPQRCSAHTQKQRGSLRGGTFKSQTFKGKKLNNAQRRSARTQKQRGSLRGGAFKTQTFEGEKFIE